MTGGGTTHRVNGIAVQRRVFGPHLPAPQLPPILKQKQRSIIHEEQPLPTYIAGERVGPGRIKASSNLMNIQEAEARNAQAWNLTWAVARQTHVGGPEGTKLDRFSCSNAKQGGCAGGRGGLFTNN